MGEFVTTESRGDGHCTITVAGEVDIATVEELVTAAEDCLSQDPRGLRVDLSQVSFIDSSGLGALVRIRNRARERGIPVELAEVPASVERVLEMTGLAAAFVSGQDG